MFEKFLPSIFSSPNRTANVQAKPVGIPNPGVRIVDGKIEPLYGFELNVVDHCNLACIDCNHASPFTAKRFANPDQVFRDFSILSKITKPKSIKLLGGEPLLHPDFSSILEAVRSSGICDHVLLVTNGLLLPRQSDAFWDAISELEISVYPDAKLDEQMLADCREKASEYNVRLEIYHYNEFRRTFSIPGSQDHRLVERIYRSCRITKVWGCHVVQEGHFFKCPQGLYIPQMLGWKGDELLRDGIKINDCPELIDDLYRYLVSPNPLQSCRHCLDSIGKRRQHTTVRPKEWLEYQKEPFASLVDYDELRRAEQEIGIQAPDDIKDKIY